MREPNETPACSAGRGSVFFRSLLEPCRTGQSLPEVSKPRRGGDANAVMKTIGLTGGIGAGKSTVSAILAELGAFVIDADKVGHEIYLPGREAWHRLVETFGREVLAPGETIDRKRLGAIVFADPLALKRLNDIVHPIMFRDLGERIRRKREEGFTAPIVVEAAVLIEASWLPLVDVVWVVVAAREVLIERVRLQRGLSTREAEARIESQLPDAERARRADLVIENTGSVADLRDRVARAWQELLASG